MTVKKSSSLVHGIIFFVQLCVISGIVLGLSSIVVPTASAASIWDRIASTFSSGPQITTTALPAASVNNTYSFQWTATGGKTPYTWSATSTLPAGFSLSSSGLLSGTPTVAATANVSVKVADARNKSANKTLSFQIIAPLTIQTVTIPDQKVGVPFSFQIQITGGTPPYTCTPDSNNNLAEFGLVLDSTCLLHGTPIKAGSVHF